MKYHIISERTSKEECTIKMPGDAYEILKRFRYDRKRTEHFLVLTMDAAHHVIKIHIVTIGILNRAIIHPREIFRPALKDNACAILIAHNHPSGNLEPSREDKDITKRISKAGDVMGINLLDHVIISKNGYYSFMEDDQESLRS